MRRRAVLVAVAATGATACAAGASADFVLPQPQRSGPNATIATDAVNDAIDAVAKRDRRCQPELVRGGEATTHDPPPQEMLDAFAVLRRPAGAGDAVDLRHWLPFGAGFAVDYIRRARVLPDGTSVYVVPALSARFARGRPRPRRRRHDRLHLRPRPQPRPRPRHDRVYQRTAAVVHNVVYLTVPRLPGDALVNRHVWHAADGSVVNTIEPPFSRAG
jgi:hypothetical protein